MVLRFTVLASGSRGNASLVEVPSFKKEGPAGWPSLFGVLIDAGLGPRQLAARLAGIGLNWSVVRAVILTHTHSDHWNERTMAHLLQRNIPLFCHPLHHDILCNNSRTFPELRARGLVRAFNPAEEFRLGPGLRCWAFPVRHDGGANFAYRIAGAPDLFGRAPCLGFATDLGSWDNGVVTALTNVDLLAVEFNHDVAMQYASGRGARLINRVLGDYGHLSNEQAANLVGAVLARSTSGHLQHIVQLHLSQDCNRPELARSALDPLIERMQKQGSVVPPFQIHTAEQDLPGQTIQLGQTPGKRSRRRRSRVRGSGPSVRRSSGCPESSTSGLDEKTLAASAARNERSRAKGEGGVRADPSESARSGTSTSSLDSARSSLRRRSQGEGEVRTESFPGAYSLPPCSQLWLPGLGRDDLEDAS